MEINVISLPVEWLYNMFMSSILCFFKMLSPQTADRCRQGVTERCHVVYIALTNSAFVYEPKCGGRRGSCGVAANECSCAHGAQINFGDLTPWLQATSRISKLFFRESLQQNLKRVQYNFKINVIKR